MPKRRHRTCCANRRLGAKFRRQCRIGSWVVDFYCFEYRFAVKLDGGVHSQPSQMERDATKEDYLRTIGIRWLQIANGLVVEDPEGFVRKVREQIEVVMDRAGAQ
jgi:very-short-patch-repair endonuclease